MPIFPNLELEPVVQVGDRTRLDASKSFITQDLGPVTLVEIDPGTGTFIDVTPSPVEDKSLWYLDYQFPTAGTKTIQARITAGSTTTVTKTVEAVSETSDYLFSDDQTLATHEPDILKWVKAGRNTFKDIHRAVQTEIMDYIDEKGFVKTDGSKYEKEDLIDREEVRQWSKFMALRIIFEGIQNAENDVFQKKAEYYCEKEIAHRNRAILRIDVDGDGAVDEQEGLSISSGSLYRR